MKQLKLLLFCLVAGVASLHGQGIRYFDPVFSKINVEEGVTYAVNASVLTIQQFGEAIPWPLRMDVYTPDGDNVTNRPLVIIMHTGNFLPPQVNGGCTGTIKDATDVAIARRLASMGYVAAVADYRLGWNPIASTQTERVFTLINAAYRGVQDSRTCIRFFRKSHANGNKYGIDPEKITLWGIGTGGYISLASATLDTITDTYIPKFFSGPSPMVIEPINGDVDGLKVGVVPPAGYPWPKPGDTLNYPNHPGFKSTFGLAVNMGGAMGDTSWIEKGEQPPIISFHVPTDPFAPCGIGIVNVPNPPLPVVEVGGSCIVQTVLNQYGNNKVFIDGNFNDPISLKARQLSQVVLGIPGGVEGFYPFINNATSSPWAYSPALEPYGIPGSNCDTNSTRAFAYIDTAIRYFAPRACAVFGLQPDCNKPVSVKSLDNAFIGMKAIPNPAAEVFSLTVPHPYIIENVELIDIAGSRVAVYNSVHNNRIEIQRNGLPPGIYFAKVKLKEGIVTQKVILK